MFYDLFCINGNKKQFAAQVIFFKKTKKLTQRPSSADCLRYIFI